MWLSNIEEKNCQMDFSTDFLSPFDESSILQVIKQRLFDQELQRRLPSQPHTLLQAKLNLLIQHSQMAYYFYNLDYP